MNLNKTSDISKKKFISKKDEQLSTARGRIFISKQAENAKNFKTKLTLPFNDANLEHTEDPLADGWQKLIMSTFEKFLLQLDELFMNLRAEENFKCSEASPDFSCYQDICEKLRLEVLIAIDKLGLVTSSKHLSKGKGMEFSNKMRNLKRQLSEIRWQYHNAIMHLR